jgi:glycosyltransferase involved in cell wall biosynthesis
VRALIVTNMFPTPERPAFGSFVADQVQALQRTGRAEIDVFPFTTGDYIGAARSLRRQYAGQRFDIVHAHFGLTIWPGLAVRARKRLVTLHGTDLAHPLSRPATLAGLRLCDLVATVSEQLGLQIPRWAAPAGRRAVLPAGVDTARFEPIERGRARTELGLDPEGPYLLFAADPSRPEKRFDRAQEIARGVPLLTLGDIEPARVPLWVNAANAVLVPSDREGFGLATLEALACDVPVLATPVGVAPDALAGIDGTLCSGFDASTWAAALAPHLQQADPRIKGRSRAQAYSTDAMAARVLDAWRGLLDR